MVKETLKSTYTDRCDILGIKKEKQPNGSTKIIEDAVIYSDEPCRLSFSSFPTTSEENNAAKASQIVRLFIRPELEIEPGTKVHVRARGRLFKYKSSGEAAVYDTHQEINLEKGEYA